MRFEVLGPLRVTELPGSPPTLVSAPRLRVLLAALLLHANQLEADHIGELLDVLRKRGYRFVTLEDALSDQAYGLPDTFVGEEGTGWIDHWAITLGKPPQAAPVFPQWVIDRSKALKLPQP